MSYRVLHVLDHSWPVLDGYSQRSRNLIAAQLRLGFQPAVVTSPLHEQDDPAAKDLTLDGVRYFRTPILANLAGRAIHGRWPPGARIRRGAASAEACRRASRKRAV